MQNISQEIMDRLKQYADEHGRNWKQKLRDQWFNGSDANEPNGHLLRQARNKIGPGALENVTFD